MSKSDRSQDIEKVTTGSPVRFVVGVSGHRPTEFKPAEVEAVRRSASKVFHVVAKAVRAVAFDAAGAQGLRFDPDDTQERVQLRLITSLAEGADRVLTEQGMDVGFEVDCALPAWKEVYREDFKTADSQAFFDNFLETRAGNVFELDGKRTGDWLEPEAYESAGRIVLSHSDLLLAVWNGQSGARGGTEQLVLEARERGMHVVIIHIGDSSHVEFFQGMRSTERDWEAALSQSLTSALRTPVTPVTGLSTVLKLPIIADSGNALQTLQSAADRIASANAKQYGRTYRALYFLAPVAVCCAVSGLWLADHPIAWIPEKLPSSIELVCILGILGLTALGRKKRWHASWFEARVLAEHFRAWSLLEPLGLTPTLRDEAPFRARDTSGDWTRAFFRMAVREHGLQTRRITSKFLETYQQRILTIVLGQLEHHRRTAHSRHRTHHIAELASFIIFFATALACIIHIWFTDLFPHLLEERAAIWLLSLGSLTATLPAIGSAIEGFMAQMEYQRLSQRAEGMAEQFEHLAEFLNRVDDMGYSELARLAVRISATMIEELSDWRNLIHIRVIHTV